MSTRSQVRRHERHWRNGAVLFINGCASLAVAFLAGTLGCSSKDGTGLDTAASSLPVASVTVAPNVVQQAVGATVQLTATPKDAAGLALTGRVVTWSSSNTGVATVNANGQVTFAAVGTATITALCEGKSGTAAITATAVVPTAGEPMYSAANADHKLHVEETWANLTSINNLFTSPRSDGGPAWVRESGTTLLHRYLGTQGDGYGSVRYLTVDFDENPPLPPDAHCACYHWYMGAPDDLAAGSDWVRGFNVGGWLNKPMKDAVVYEWALRERGTNWYEGKYVDIGAGESGGIGRWLFDHFKDPFGIGGPDNCTDALCQLYYTNNGNTARFSGLPTTSKSISPAIHRSQSAELPGATGGSSFIVYKQNLAYGLQPGQFIWSQEAGDTGPTNSDLSGNNVLMWNAGWLYYKLQITREPATTPYMYGQGRLEMWIGKTPGALTKVMDYRGDPGELAQGKVWVAPNASTPWTETVHFFQPTARVYMGGAIVDLGTVRIWSHSRQ